MDQHLHAELLRDLAVLVDLSRAALPRSPRSCAAASAASGAAADLGVLQPHDLEALELLLQAGARRRAHVRARHGQAVPVQHGAKLLRLHLAVVGGRLHFLVADLRHLRERALVVLRRQVADRIQFEADLLLPVGRGRSRLCGPARQEQRGAFQKGSSVHSFRLYTTSAMPSSAGC